MNYWLVFIIESLAIALIGGLLHFTYGWSKQNKIVAIFSAVNESTWEHVKLALSGVFCCMLVDVWFLGDNPNYWLARSVSFLIPVAIIPLLFYGYQIWSKCPILWVDILIFFVAAVLSSAAFVGILQSPAIGAMGGAVSIVISVVIITAYLLLTRFPLHNNFLFEDPVTHEYGYEGYNHKRHSKKSKRRK